MADLSEKRWEEYLAKSKRDVLWRAQAELSSAAASLTVGDQQALHDECLTLLNKVEVVLKELYKDA